MWRLIIYVDIDNTICTTSEDHHGYTRTSPLYERIEKINALFDAGHKIIYWTARGSKTKIDYRQITKHQLRSWGVKYHKLKFYKPVYDLFIDDKAINSESFFKLCDQTGQIIF